MPLHSYGVLKGRAIEGRPERADRDSPHYQVHLDAAGTRYRIAVNVLSQLPPSELLFVADETFEHPITAQLPALGDGFTAIASKPGGIALDYIRGNLFTRTDLRPVPATTPGPDNDLADRLDHFVTRAVADPDARIYAFGERWGPEATTADKVFGFRPGNGIHDIHMNQGNSGRFVGDDGVWQDGGLILHFPGEAQWVAIFLAFQSQAFHTDDRTGHAISGTGRPTEPAPTEPDHTVRVIAALVNPTGPAPEAETVTLLNTSSQDVDLTGWALADRTKTRMPLPSEILPAGEALRVAVRPPVALGNSGGLITLLDPAGLKVDGVAYTKADARKEGRTLTF